MKFCKRALALALAALLAISLTGCSKDEMRDIASDWIIKAATKMGFRSEDTGEEEEVVRNTANQGGSIVFPDGFDPTNGRIPTLVQDGVMYVGFNGIQYKSTDYFVAADSTVTITAYASHTNPNMNEINYKAALWELSEDQRSTVYVPDTTVYFAASEDKSCYTATVSGLTAGRRYKISISYDTGLYYITGGMTVSPVSNEALTAVEGADGAS